MAKLSPAELAGILKRPGYRVADARGHPFDKDCGCAACSRDRAERNGGINKAAGVHDLKRWVAESKLEIRFAQQLADNGIHPVQPGELVWKGTILYDEGEKQAYSPSYVRNYLDAIRGRSFELDFAWPQMRFFVEVDGGAHRTKGRFKADFAKHAELVLARWQGFRVGGADVREGRAIDWTMQWLKRHC